MPVDFMFFAPPPQKKSFCDLILLFSPQFDNVVRIYSTNVYQNSQQESDGKKPEELQPNSRFSRKFSGISRITGEIGIRHHFADKCNYTMTEKIVQSTRRQNFDEKMTFSVEKRLKGC